MKRIITIFLVATMLLAPTLSLAALDPSAGDGTGGGTSKALEYNLLETVSGRIQADQSISLADYLEEAFKWVLGMVALLAVLMLIMTGVAYTAAGVSESAKTAAKNQLTSILWGVGVMLGAYILLYTINPDLLDVKLDFSKLRSGAPLSTGVLVGGEEFTNPYTLVAPLDGSLVGNARVFDHIDRSSLAPHQKEYLKKWQTDHGKTADGKGNSYYINISEIEPQKARYSKVYLKYNPQLIGSHRIENLKDGQTIMPHGTALVYRKSKNDFRILNAQFNP